jgi:hypothetical protein
MAVRQAPRRWRRGSARDPGLCAVYVASRRLGPKQLPPQLLDKDRSRPPSPWGANKSARCRPIGPAAGPLMAVHIGLKPRP